MQQSQLEMQTESLAELLEKDAKEIDRIMVVDCYHMALKRRNQLMEIVDAEKSAWRQEQLGSTSGAGSSSSDPVAP